MRSQNRGGPVGVGAAPVNEKAGELYEPENSEKAGARQPKYRAQAKWRANNQRAVWAQKALHSAMRRGLVEKQPCAICGDEKSEAHHPDYSRPADVIWLCRKHHRQAHREGRR